MLGGTKHTVARRKAAKNLSDAHYVIMLISYFLFLSAVAVALHVEKNTQRQCVIETLYETYEFQLQVAICTHTGFYLSTCHSISAVATSATEAFC